MLWDGSSGTLWKLVCSIRGLLIPESETVGAYEVGLDRSEPLSEKRGELSWSSEYRLFGSIDPIGRVSLDNSEMVENRFAGCKCVGGGESLRSCVFGIWEWVGISPGSSMAKALGAPGWLGECDWVG